MPPSTFLKPPTIIAPDTVDDDNDGASEIFLRPLAEEREPLLNSKASRAQESNDGSHKSLRGGYLDPAMTRKPRNPISGKSTPRPRLGDRASTADSIQTLLHSMGHDDELRIKDRQLGDKNGIRSLTSRTLRRSSSSFPPETRHPQRDSALIKLDSAALRQRLIDETKHNGKRSVRPWRSQRMCTISGPLQSNHLASPRTPSFKWFAVRSNSDPSTPLLVPMDRRGKDFPLKPCMKQKSKSAATTPPRYTAERDEVENGLHLRRVKVVDFEVDFSKKSLSPPLSEVWINQAGSAKQKMGKWSILQQHGGDNASAQLNTSRSLPSCPGPTLKSKPADTAITRTDVHVIAIAPSWTSDAVLDEGSIDPATPTMQIVESETGCYEVIWDDVPPEDGVRTQRRRSPASLSLHTARSAGAKGLERVNTKLTEWSWRGESPETIFKPRIIVFPDVDDGYVTQLEFTGEEDEGILPAPPSSERTSADVSGQPSGPPSIRPSRNPSSTGTDSGSEYGDNRPEKKADSQQVALVVPELERTDQFGSRINASRAVRKPLSNRRLSNVEDAELRFRDHRDSVTLARSRMFNAGGVSPELFRHRDSIAMAKKRMHLRNHAVSSPRQIYNSRLRFSDPLPPIDDIDLSPPDTLKKQNASKSLKESASASILVPHQAKPNRHIQIIE